MVSIVLRTRASTRTAADVESQFAAGEFVDDVLGVR
jgi:hypothetical protein